MTELFWIFTCFEDLIWSSTINIVLVKELVNTLLSGTTATQQRRVVKGIAGIVELFDVAPSTAQRYKDGFLAPAIQQAGKGCSFVVDVEIAKELFNNHKNQ